jgi:hypothetical protein
VRSGLQTENIAGDKWDGSALTVSRSSPICVCGHAASVQQRSMHEAGGGPAPAVAASSGPLVTPQIYWSLEQTTLCISFRVSRVISLPFVARLEIITLNRSRNLFTALATADGSKACSRAVRNLSDLRPALYGLRASVCALDAGSRVALGPAYPTLRPRATPQHASVSWRVKVFVPAYLRMSGPAV